MEEKKISLAYLSETLGEAFKGFGGPDDAPAYILCWEYSLKPEHRKFLKELGAKGVKKIKTDTIKYHFPSTIKLVDDLPKI